MRRLLLGLALLTGIAGSYAATPLVTAWRIQEAMRSGDVAALRSSVDWPSVRHSLKISLEESRGVLIEIANATGDGRPSLWQRVKRAAMPYFSGSLIDRYVTAERAPRLFALGQTWRKRVKPTLGLAEPPSVLAGTSLEGTSLDRSLSLMRRVRSYRMQSPTRVEIAIADRYRSGRSWLATLEFRNLAWRLTAVRVREAAPGATATRHRRGSANAHRLPPPAARG